MLLQLVKYFDKMAHRGPVRESNPGPLAPKARIMPLDQQAKRVVRSLDNFFNLLLP